MLRPPLRGLSSARPRSHTWGRQRGWGGGDGGTGVRCRARAAGRRASDRDRHDVQPDRGRRSADLRRAGLRRELGLPRGARDRPHHDVLPEHELLRARDDDPEGGLDERVRARRHGPVLRHRVRRGRLHRHPALPRLRRRAVPGHRDQRVPRRRPHGEGLGLDLRRLPRAPQPGRYPPVRCGRDLPHLLPSRSRC